MSKKDKDKRPEAAREAESMQQARRTRVADMPDATAYVTRLCTKEKPCGMFYAVPAFRSHDTGIRMMSADPLSSLEINDTELAYAGVFEFTEAFYTFMGAALPSSDVRKLAPFFDAGVRLLADRRPYALGLLRERYALGRSIRSLVGIYSTHHETLDRQLSTAMHALRDCVLEAQREDVA